MSPELIGLLSVPIAILLVVFGMPVGFTMAFAGIGSLVLIRGIGVTINLTGMVAYTSVAAYAFTIVPMFVFMSNIILYTRYGNDAYKVARQWVGHLPGGLAQASTIACAMYGAVTGHTMAPIVSLGKIAISEMRKAGYHDRLSTGSVVCAGTFAIMIPPSMGLVFYAIAVEVSIGDMLLAGYIPGIVTAVVYMITIWIIVRVNPASAPVIPKAPLGERISGLKEVWGIVVLILAILYLLYSGIITPTEVGAVGSAAVVLLGLVARRLKMREIWNSFVDTARLSGSLFFVLIGALIYSASFTVSNIPTVIADWILGLNAPAFVIAVLLLLIFLILGLFMSPLAITFLMAPLTLPVAVGIGIHPVMFGIIFTKCMEIGSVTPPFGVNLFALKGVMPDINTRDLIIGILPFILADLVVIGLIFLFPSIALFLPLSAK